MKKPLIFLALSLAANAALLVTFLVRPKAPDRASSAASAVASAAPAAGDATLAGTGLSVADANALKRSRELLMGGDLRSLVARLRAAGFSPSMIAVIVSAQVNEQFGARRVALLSSTSSLPFWKNSNFPFGDRKTAAEFEKLNREQNALIKELLGSNPPMTDEFSQMMRKRNFGDLPPEKIDRLQTVMNDYNELRSQVHQEARGVILPEDREKLALIEKEQRADLVKLLSPAELEEYDLRNSNTSHQLRSRLASFDATEEEFRAIFRLSREFDAQFGEPGAFTNAPPTPETMRARQEAQTRLQAEIAATLGPERAAEYKLATDPNYQQVNQLLTRLELPSSIAPQVVAVQQDIQQRANTLRQNRTLSAEERNTQLTALADEARTQLTATLGQRGYDAYKTYGGWWLNNLAPRPAPSPGTNVAIPIGSTPKG